MPAQNSGGAAGTCTGSFARDWLAYMAGSPGALGHPLHPGQTFYAQAWFRDPAAPSGSNLSDGVVWATCP
jgi:hypothetical protein